MLRAGLLSSATTKAVNKQILRTIETGVPLCIMMSIQVDLIPNRDLIDPFFSGYKLSLDALTVYERSIDRGVIYDSQCEEQYSYSHAKIFSLHNYLYYNSFLPQHVYFVDELGKINQVHFNHLNRVREISIVAEIPLSLPRVIGAFPISINFPSENIAVICDGTETFYVASIQKDRWIIDVTHKISSIPAVLLHTHFSNNEITLMWKLIEGPKFDSVIKICTLHQNEHSKSENIVKVLGTVDFGLLETQNHVLLICASTPLFSANSDPNTSPDVENKYRWTQTSDDVTVWFNVDSNDKSEVTVCLEGERISVVIKGKKLIDGELFCKAKESNWKVDNGKLELMLLKEIKEVVWPELVKGDTTGVEIKVEELETDQTYSQEKVEDVDISTPSTLFRLDLEKKAITQKVDLTTSPFLFPVSIDPRKSPAICLRHLSDAFVWQFEVVEDYWKQVHKGTFNAFGYIQASKTQKKFIVAPPDLSYVVICDAFRHLFIYRQPSAVNGNLRNRTSGERVKTVAKLQLVNLETHEEILGICADGAICFVLTKTKLFSIVINE